MKIKHFISTRILNRGLRQQRHSRLGLDPHIEIRPPSSHATITAGKIRGSDHEPSIHLHGILPRSGTNFVGELIQLHPSVHAFPNNIYEFPFLEGTGELLEFSERFFNAYQRNRTQIGESDFLPIFGASAISYLHGYASSGKRMLLKVPDVQFLNHFFTVYPNENLLILTRDGRDLVQSTIKSWPQRNFADVCRLWDASAKMIINHEIRHANHADRFLVIRFEDAVQQPEAIIRRICNHFELDFSVYPLAEIGNLPVKGSSELRRDGKMTWTPMQKPKGFNPIGRWQSWPDKRKRVFKKICGDTMINMGYCDDLNW
jgi:protein-tyrosine sulfotransferase